MSHVQALPFELAPIAGEAVHAGNHSRMQSSVWLHDFSGPRAAPRLLVFPHAGAGPTAYFALAGRWAGHTRPGIVHLPGRESRLAELPFEDLTSLTRTLLWELLPALDPPYVFYGHSMGALVAFELARQARRMLGAQPDHLVVSGCGSPRVTGRHLRHLLPDEELWSSIQKLGGLPEAIAGSVEMRSLLLPAFRADFRASETYAYEHDRPLGCPITVFAGRSDSEVSRSDAEGWRDETTGPFRCQILDGGHFFNLGVPGEFAARVLAALG